MNLLYVHIDPIKNALMSIFYKTPCCDVSCVVLYFENGPSYIIPYICSPANKCYPPGN